jgi:ribose 5-phosphate isomerase
LRWSPTRATTTSWTAPSPDGDLAALASALKAVLGVVEHGLFVDQADEVLLGHPDGTLRTLHR